MCASAIRPHSGSECHHVFVVTGCGDVQPVNVSRSPKLHPLRLFRVDRSGRPVF